MHEITELNEPTDELDNLQKHFSNIIQARMDFEAEKLNPQGQLFTENLMEREDIEEFVKVETVRGLLMSSMACSRTVSICLVMFQLWRGPPTKNALTF